ncbi:MAG: sixA [Verrucomicrobia bacterium]|nr:sixA [Verrucomicrobiota bacterium]
MEIYLIRHAHAVEGKDDAARPLSKRGKAQIRAVGRFLKGAGILGAEEFWHSPLVRSRDTAKLLVRRLKKRVRFSEVKGLLHDDNPSILARRLGKTRKPVAVVGHEPHLTALASLMVSGKPKPPLFELKKCGVMALARTEGRWVLRWQVSPEVLG